MYCLPNSLATTIEVPLPQKKSATTSPSFDDAFIIIDEAENLSKKETLLLIGRMGEGNTKIVLLGDKEQCDRKGLRDSSDCGLVHAKERLKDVEGVAIDEFNNNDIVRNTFITKIFEKW